MLNANIKELLPYREIVAKKSKDGKICRIISKTRLATVVRELKRRGFIEMTVLPQQCVLNRMTLMQLCQEASDGNDYEKALISKLLGETFVPNFVWLSKQSQYSFFHSSTHVNRIEFMQRNFTIKHNMVKIARDIEQKYKSFNFPRTVEIINDEDIANFEVEFQWTIVTSFIAMLHRDFRVSDDCHALSCEAVDIALSMIQTGYLNGFEIVHRTYLALLQNPVAHFYGRQLTRIMYINKIKAAAEDILEKWPDRENDGIKNVWIIKPSTSNRGEGILVSNKKDEILAYINRNDEEYVIQKYIENPLLIFSAKFDMRQYFVITIDKTSICGWAHPRCHVKLASNAFTLDSFSESVHVTNFTVQKKYNQRTSENLPRNHIWSMEDLDKFLVQQCNNRKPGVFDRLIFPEIKKTLNRICEASRGDIECRAGRFELFGCDWMITENMDVQLIEINRGPSLEHLTSITTAALQEVLVDLVKIAVDRYYDPNADTGGFEKIYEENIEKFVIQEQSDSGYSSRKSSVESSYKWSTPSKSDFFQLQ